MDTRSQTICLWSGFAFMPIYMIGFVLIAGFIPPPSPSLGALAIAQLFSADHMRIVSGMSIAVVASGLFVPWTISIFGQMLRVEKTRIPAFSFVQLGSGMLSAAFFMIPPLFWVGMAYRPGHLPDTLLLLNDYSWLAWLISWPFFFVQNMSVGLCALMYENSVFPRWFGYLSIFSSIGMIPMSAMAFVFSGPFAWNGLFGLYLPVGLYSVWYVSMFFVLRKAIHGEAVALAQAPAPVWT